MEGWLLLLLHHGLVLLWMVRICIVQVLLMLLLDLHLLKGGWHIVPVHASLHLTHQIWAYDCTKHTRTPATQMCVYLDDVFVCVCEMCR